MTIPEPIIVVEGTVMRVTGAGNFILYPDQRTVEVHDGSRVIVLNSSINPVQVSLEVIRERVTDPYPSDLALIVGARKRVERCSALCNGRQMSAEDSMGKQRTELPLPVGGYLYFRIPEEVAVDDESTVDVRDGDSVLRRERFGRIIGAAEALGSTRGRFGHPNAGEFSVGRPPPETTGSPPTPRHSGVIGRSARDGTLFYTGLYRHQPRTFAVVSFWSCGSVRRFV